MKKSYTSEIKQIGKKIKKIRLSKNMTQQTLADYCDVDIRTIQRIEKGEHGLSLHIFLALADALGTSASDLLKN